MKTCTKCLRNLEKFNFSFKNKKLNKLHTVCKFCQKSYTNKYYEQNKEIHIKKNKGFVLAKRKKLYEIVNKIKEAPCKDCNQVYPPYVMDFDHIDPSTKLNTISKMILCSSSLKKIMEEINKCEVVCSNCHRIRTYNRRLGKMPEPGLLGQS